MILGLPGRQNASGARLLKEEACCRGSQCRGICVRLRFDVYRHPGLHEQSHDGRVARSARNDDGDAAHLLGMRLCKDGHGKSDRQQAGGQERANETRLHGGGNVAEQETPRNGPTNSAAEAGEWRG